MSSIPVCTITDLDVHAGDDWQEGSDDLGAAQGILLAVMLGLPIWAVSVWLVL